MWSSYPTVTECVIRANMQAGIRCSAAVATSGQADDPLIADSIIVERCEIAGNLGCGVLASSGSMRVSWCQFHGNKPYGVNNISAGQDIDARLNCWGHPTGPGGSGPGLGDAVSDHVVYYPWLANGVRVTPSSRFDATAMNNARKIVRDECPPFYKLAYTDGMGIWIAMTSDPVNGPWEPPVEVWPVDLLHHSTDPAIAIEWNDELTTTNPNSILHLVWAEHIPDETAPGEIYHAWSGDGGFTWSPPENLSDTPSPSEHPSVAVDGLGIVHVVWDESPTFSPEVFYTNSSVEGWTEPANISRSPLASVYPTIAGNYAYVYGTMPVYPPDDRVHIAWTEFEPGPIGDNTPWIAYRSYDPVWGWIPSLDSLPEDATQGQGGAFASIIAYTSFFEVGRAAAVVWHWPDDEVQPPVGASQIYFNERTTGAWGAPRLVWSWQPSPRPSRYPSLAIEAGPLGDTLWVVWEEWNVPVVNRSEVYSAYSTDFGTTWNFYLNLSQTTWDLSRYPGLAYQKGVTFRGLYDVCWTEIPLFGESGEPALQGPAYVYYIGATALRDSIYAGMDQPAPATPDVLVRCSPNPARGQARFALATEQAGAIAISIYDVRGRLVRSLASTCAEPGPRVVTWNGRDSDGNIVGSGIYYFEVTRQDAVPGGTRAARATATGKLIMLR